MARTTILSLLEEMQSFVSVSPETIAKAKASKIHFHNNESFRDLTRAWVNGDYDEDPGMIVSECESLLYTEQS